MAAQASDILDHTPVGVVAAGTPAPSHVRKLQLFLIKPSKYDDEGYVMRYFRGVLPSNTLATLAGLTEEVVERGDLGDVHVEIVMMDEHVQKIDVKKLARKYLRSGIQPVAALCGVQTNQFPRAADLARRFHAAGIPVMIGGFHVSGAIAMSENGIPPECQELIDEGITLVKGEVEETWGEILRDALHGKLKTYYNVMERPDLSLATIPVVDPKLMKRFAYPNMGTIDAGRGCPFNCSFCTIINVQGRKMRNRLAERIKDRVRRNVAMKIDYYFFTDDNFSRNPNWESIFDALIELRRDEGVKVGFMMQIDTLAYRIKNFMAKAREAGCTQAFIGMETINPANIPASGKRQNRVEDYRNMIDSWHEHGIACHVGYIIGFPFDTVESVRDDVRRLKEEIGVDQVSFFMLTPLPGSKDHQEAARRGDWMDDDYNKFDSFHPTTNHPLMSSDEWFDVYKQVWHDFYSVDAMKTVLQRANDNTYWGLFKNFVWYKYSAIIEHTHPMICGFFRFKDRTDRRPGFAVESRWAHLRRRTHEVARLSRDVVRLYFEMQEVWLATRGRARWKAGVEEWRKRAEDLRERFDESRARAGEALSRRVTIMRQGAGEAWEHGRQAAAARLEGGQRWMSKINPLSLRRIHTRTHLNTYWRQTWDKVRRGRVFAINPLRLGINFLRDVKLCAIFNVSFFMTGYGR
jgi:radical SAM superfamily enzyme YgiQ (UPF0313 family)